MQKKAKEKIKKLIQRYEEVRRLGKLRSYTEEETKKDFILPLFEMLGWDIYNKNEVSAEENIISSGRVDYGFYFNNRIKFYLETKRLSVDLHKEEFANQAIRYSWNKGATWAVLTDFESLKVFNAQDTEKSLNDKLFFEIPYTKYIDRFNQLWLLSKEAFSKKALDKEAEKYGKKLQKISVTSLLYKDLQKCRDILTKDLGICNPGINKDLLDEGVQRLLDRLIFIRVAEDREIEPLTLIPLIREAYTSNKKAHLYQSMVKKFRELNDTYNSNLFLPHPFEQWEEYSGVTAKVINILYGKKGYYEYDFKAMPADVLGAVYENYLGYRLSQSKKGINVAKDARKRKEHGIYYTPSFIVDYIVENALGPTLNKCRTIADLKKIKVLDLACGSGSFLVKVLEMINDKYKDFGFKDNALIKLQILTENIYGVDLDEQAVEIARLNLLINSLSEQMKLPLLTDNIKNGNSLIFGTDEELKKYFGKNFREKRSFNWEEEFPEVFKQGGFDVIIGNPPWVSNDNIEAEEKKIFENLYQLAKGRYDLANLFVEKSLNLIKENGFLGFVMPEHVWLGEYFIPFRQYISKNTKIMEIISAKEESFEQVANPASIFLCQNTKPSSVEQKVFLGSFKDGNISDKFKIKTNIIKRVMFDKFAQRLNEKIYKLNLSTLGEIAQVTDGIQTADLLKTIFTKEPEDKKMYYKALRSGKAIKFRYAPIEWGEWWVLKPEHTKKLKRPGFSYDSPKRMTCFSAEEKIILRQTEPTIFATLDVNGYFFPNSIFQIALEKGNPQKLRSILGILNSRFLRFFYSKLAQVEKTTKPQIYLNLLKALPIPQEFDLKIAELTAKILDLNQQLQVVPENSNKWHYLKSKIEKTDKKINEEVYKLYDLTSEEIRIVEGFNK